MSSKTKTKAKSKKRTATRKTKAKARPKAVKEEAQIQKAEPEPEKELVAKAKRPAERREGPKLQVDAPPEKLGKPPSALVSSRHVDAMRERAGRGFSFGELDTAGVPVGRAKREGLSVDVRRRSILEGNVEALNVWYRTPAPSGDGQEQRES